MASTPENLVDAKYGPELGIYLSEAGYKRSRELALSLTRAHIADAVKSLADPELVTYRTFETLMALEWNPVCNHIDLILGDSKVYPLCIQLLRPLAADDGDILGNAYGFMCLQFIALAMEIAKIAQGDRLPAFQEEISKLLRGRSMSSILNNYSRELEGEGIWYNIGNVDKFAHYLGWDWGPDRYRACLPQIGWCGFKDTMFLLTRLWAERAVFLEAAQVASSIFPGWGGFLYVIWHAVLENLGWHDNPTKLAPRERRELMWTFIFEIGLRYAMCSEMREDPLAYVIINNHHLRMSLSKPNSYEPVDDEDAILVATCTTRKLRSLSTINEMNNMATGVLGYASMLLCSIDFKRHVKELYKAAFHRAWNEISEVHRMDNHRWCTFAIHLEEKHAKHPMNAKALLDLALDWDLHELYAYTLLFPLSQLGQGINVAEKLGDNIERDTGMDILASGRRITETGVHVDRPYKFFPVWDKILNHIRFYQCVLERERKPRGRDLEALWIGATRTFLVDILAVQPPIQELLWNVEGVTLKHIAVIGANKWIGRARIIHI